MTNHAHVKKLIAKMTPKELAMVLNCPMDAKFETEMNCLSDENCVKCILKWLRIKK